MDTDAPEIVETVEVEKNPDIEKLLAGSSLFGGEDVDLKNLLVGLIPQPPPSASGSSDEVLLFVFFCMSSYLDESPTPSVIYEIQDWHLFLPYLDLLPVIDVIRKIFRFRILGRKKC